VVKSRELPFELEADGYKFEYEGGHGNLWVWTVSAEANGEAVHVTVDVSKEDFEKLHITPVNAAWSVLHVWYGGDQWSDVQGVQYMPAATGQQAMAWYGGAQAALDAIAQAFFTGAGVAAGVDADGQDGEGEYQGEYYQEGGYPPEGYQQGEYDGQYDAGEYDDGGLGGPVVPAIDTNMGSVPGMFLDNGHVIYPGMFTYLDVQYISGMVTDLDGQNPRAATEDEINAVL
jgi:hypothetical protein